MHDTGQYLSRRYWFKRRTNSCYGTRSFVYMSYDITGPKRVNNFRHWTLSWASSNQLTSSQTIFSRTVSAFTARIWMHLPLIYSTNCTILAVTEHYCVMSNRCDDLYYVISPATLPLTVLLETCIRHLLRSV